MASYIHQVDEATCVASVHCLSSTTMRTWFCTPAHLYVLVAAGAVQHAGGVPDQLAIVLVATCVS